MALADWMGQVETLMESVMSTAKTDAVINTDAQVYGYEEWPDQIPAAPVVLIGVTGGSQAYSVGGPATAHHTLLVRILIGGITLAEAQKMLNPFIARVRNKFAANIQLSSTVEHIRPPTPPELFYQGPGMIEYGGVDYPGLLFTFDVKENESGDFTVSA